MIPKFGTPEYDRWRERLIATCYDILAANRAFESLRRREYAPEFSRRRGVAQTVEQRAHNPHGASATLAPATKPSHTSSEGSELEP